MSNMPEHKASVERIGNTNTPPSHALSQEEADKLRSEALTTTQNGLPEGYFASMRIIGTFAGISLCLVATYFALQAASGVIIAINNDIGPSENSSLFSIVWTIAQPISILIFGRLSDQFGRRNFALGSCVLGVVGGIVAATAQTMNTLIGAMVLLGLASGVPASYPLLTGELATNKGKFLATLTVVVPNIIATGFGPYIGQRLVVVTQLHGEEPKRWDQVKKIDFIGTFLLVAGLTLFLLGVSWGGTSVSLPWNSPRILGLLISGFVALVAFVLYECLAPIEQPIIPMRFFRDVRGFGMINIVSAVTGCINIALFIIWPSQVVRIFGSSNSGWEQTAWMSCTANFGLWSGIILFGPLFHVVKHIRWQLIIGCAWMAIFLGVMTTINRNHKNTAIAISYISCLPIGWGEVITMLLVQYVVEDQDLGIGFAVTSANRTILGSIFTAIFVAILNNKLPGELDKHLVSQIIDAGLPESSVPSLLQAVAAGAPAAIAAVPGMNSELLEVVSSGAADSFAGAYAYVYYTALALALAAAIAAVFVRDMDHYLTDHVSRQIYHKEETRHDILQSKGISGSEIKEA